MWSVVLGNSICKDMFGVCMFKCCQDCTNDSKVCDGLTFISIKGIQSICIKLLITCTKKGGKGWQEWHKACMAIGVSTQKLKIIIKFSLLPKWFFLKNGISTHNLLLWKSIIIGTSMSCAKITSLGVITKLVVNLGPMVQQCVLNQS